ncbi:MAG: M55 family metallopeptidase, partial [Clostridia bacterium]
EVYIWDNHGTGCNLDYNALDPRVKIVMGAGSKKRFPCIDSDFSGVLFIGYHAYDVPYATLAHVYSSSTYQYQKINDDFVGEMQIDAAIAGEYNVPVIFASSDDICISQAKESFKNIVTVETKKSLAWNSCISKHPKAVVGEIYEKVKIAAQNAANCNPFRINGPFKYEVRFKRTEYAVGCQLRNPDNTPFELPDAYTRRGILENPAHIFEF